MNFIKLLWSKRPAILTREFWVTDFPTTYDDECFMCKLDSTACPTCEKRTWVIGADFIND